MNNLEKLSQIDTMAQFIYDTDSLDNKYCHDCQYEDEEIDKNACLSCIKEWLNKEVSND